jgi:tRNA (guanine-N7-)-methyltransferase
MSSPLKPNPYLDAPRLPEHDKLDPRVLLGAGNEPVELEIGPGRGGFLFERLAAAPGVFMLGLEIRRKWASIVDAALRERGFGERARVFAEDCRAVVPRFPDACVSAVYVHFPDPWWKKRHQKRRVVSSELVSQAARILVSGGELFIQTDVRERAEEYRTLLSAEPRLSSMPLPPEPINRFSARSPRERRAIADGLPVYGLSFRRL